MNWRGGLEAGAMVRVVGALLVVLVSSLVAVAAFLTVRTSEVFGTLTELNALLGIAWTAFVCAAVSMVVVMVYVRRLRKRTSQSR